MNLTSHTSANFQKIQLCRMKTLAFIDGLTQQQPLVILGTELQQPSLLLSPPCT